MNDDVVIRVKGLSKRYGLPLPEAYYRGRRWLRSHRAGHNPQSGPGGSASYDGPWALRDINLEVKRGEVLGVIGRNGAGKSTLLKVLAGVTPPTRGTVDVHGRVFPMIELNAGLHLELTGRENVQLLAVIMGLSKGEQKERVPQIEEFCELNEWFDRPVRQYSSGMLARLGFAVAVAVEADILLVDEVLAVGDITFQRKCFERIEKMHNAGKAVLFVSHSIRQVERLCNRVLLLEQGEQVALGPASDTISQYYAATNRAVLRRNMPTGQAVNVPQELLDNAPVDVLEVRLLNGQGEDSVTFYTGESLTIEVKYRAHVDVDHAIIGFGISTIDNFPVSGFTNEQAGFNLPLKGNGLFRCRMCALPLLGGIYTVQLKISRPDGGILGGGYGLAIFEVRVPGYMRLSADYGIIMIETQWETSCSTDTGMQNN